MQIAGLFYALKNTMSNNVYLGMKSHHIKLDEETEKFLRDYNDSHGVSKQKFVEMAVREKILNVKAELKLNEYVNNK